MQQPEQKVTRNDTGRDACGTATEPLMRGESDLLQHGMSRTTPQVASTGNSWDVIQPQPLQRGATKVQMVCPYTAGILVSWTHAWHRNDRLVQVIVQHKYCITLTMKTCSNAAACT